MWVIQLLESKGSKFPFATSLQFNVFEALIATDFTVPSSVSYLTA